MISAGRESQARRIDFASADAAGFHALRDAWRDAASGSRLPKVAHRIASLLPGYVSREYGYAFPSDEQLASTINCSQRLVKKGVVALEQARLIERHTIIRRDSRGEACGRLRRIYLTMPPDRAPARPEVKGTLRQRVKGTVPRSEGNTTNADVKGTPAEGEGNTFDVKGTNWVSEGNNVFPIYLTETSSDTVEERGSGSEERKEGVVTREAGPAPVTASPKTLPTQPPPSSLTDRVAMAVERIEAEQAGSPALAGAPGPRILRHARAGHSTDHWTEADWLVADRTIAWQIDRVGDSRLQAEEFAHGFVERTRLKQQQESAA